MRILFRYVLREFLVPLCYCLGGFVSIYVLFELFGSFARLSEAKLPFGTVVQYFAGYLAPYFEWVAPAALMLATLYTMWSFCRHSEVVAMRASGVGLFAIVRPVLLVACVVAAFVGWVDECYVPRYAQWAKTLRNEKFDLEKVARADNLVLRNAAADRTWSIGKVRDPGCRHLEDVRVSEDRPDGGARLRTITAARADYLDGEGWLSDAHVQHPDATGRETATPTPALDALPLRVFPEFSEHPDELLAQNRDWQFNSVRDRLRYLRTHPELTPRVRRKYVYDAWAQAVAPLACIIITLFAIPAGVATGRQSVFRGILTALVMFFAFYALTIGCMVAADAAWLPPVVAALLPDVVFFALALRSFRKNR